MVNINMRLNENFKILKKYNYMLIKRVGVNQNLSYLYLIFSVVFLLIFTFVPLFTELISFSSTQEKQEFYIASLIIVAILDLVFTLYRISKNTVIEDTHIILFPTSFLNKIVSEVKMILFDLRFVIYIPVALIFTLKVVLKEFSVINIIASVGMFVGFYFIVTVALLITFSILKIFFHNKRNNIINTVLIFPIAFSLLNISGQKDVLFKIPVLSNIGNFYCLFIQNSSDTIITDIFIVLLAILLLMSILVTLRYKQKIRWY